MLGTMDADARAQLRDALEPVFVPGGTVLIREGDPADCLYLVAAGRLRVVTVDDEGTEIQLARDRARRPRRRDGPHHEPAAHRDRPVVARHAPAPPLDRGVHPARRRPSRIRTPHQHGDGRPAAPLAARRTTEHAGGQHRVAATRAGSVRCGSSPSTSNARWPGSPAPRARSTPRPQRRAVGEELEGRAARGVERGARDRERRRRLPRRPRADHVDPGVHPPGRPVAARRRRDDRAGPPPPRARSAARSGGLAQPDRARARAPGLDRGPTRHLPLARATHPASSSPRPRRSTAPTSTASPG